MKDQTGKTGLEKFEQWAIVEVYGHEKYAGLIQERTVFGKAMAELIVPEIEATENYVALPGFTKVISPDSIFSITPVTEEYARAMAAELKKQPIAGYEHQAIIKSAAKKMVKDLTLAEVQNILTHQALPVETS